MRNVMTFVAAAVLMSTSALAGNDYVYVEFNDEKERLSRLDLKTMSVCSLKQQVAEMFDLQIRKFELKTGGRRLRDDRTLDGDAVYSGRTIDVVEMSSSFQCT